MKVSFLLNGETVEVDCAPTTTLLDWLRESRGLMGTKEGCNEGDCGACTVMVIDKAGARALNACILFLPQLQGKALRTVEGISGPDGQMHPVQEAMIEHHGAQCGFCTPGFVVSMATAHLNGSADHANDLAGNLCRCTGYAPILRAAEAAQTAPVPDWVQDAPPAASVAAAGKEAEGALPPSSDALATWYLDHPEGTLIAGATDVGLWVTKGFQDLGPVAFLHACTDLQQIDVTDTEIRIGAGVTLAQLHPVMADHHPSFAEVIRRYGSLQVRNAATVGGNIANGSPIGDSPPALIALGATLHLRQGDTRRSLPLEDFFLTYGKQDRGAGEFVEAVSLPRQQDRLFCYKVSKRFDQDISALCGAFNITVEAGQVTAARIAFGGMAGTPLRARATEAALIGQPWTQAGITAAQAALAADYQPISDMRASAPYRQQTAQNMLARALAESTGEATSVLAVQP